MGAKRRKIEVFSLSFLDCICCGFGAVILLFVIINARSNVVREEELKDLKAEADMLAFEVLEGQQGLVELKNSLEEKKEAVTEAHGEASRLIAQIETQKVAVAEFQKQSLATKEHVNKLKADIKSLEEETRRLQAGSEENDDKGQQTRSFEGDGNRQYLTGLRVRGKHILILVDASASMTSEKLSEAVSLRDQPAATRRNTPKWQRAVSTVDWITTQLPQGAFLQVLTYADLVTPVLEPETGDWLDGSNPTLLNDMVSRLREQVTPEGGSSLYLAFEAAKNLSPMPDTIFLIADGLPTFLKKRGKGTVSGQQRLTYFKGGIAARPARVPINIFLFPMEGDPSAAPLYWKLAVDSRGSFMVPSSDWP